MLKCSIIICHYISWFSCCYLKKQDTYKISYNRYGVISICFLFNTEWNDYKEVTKSAVWRSHHVENDAKLSVFLEAPKNTLKVTSNKNPGLKGGSPTRGTSGFPLPVQACRAALEALDKCPFLVFKGESFLSRAVSSLQHDIKNNMCHKTG